MSLPAPTESSTALITGASSGIGEEIARQLAGRGYALTLTARREERLRQLATELEEAHGTACEVIAADIGSEAGRDGLAAALEAAGREVTVLVNNAGFGDAADFADADRDKLLRMVRLNCEALTDMQARYLPRMVASGAGAVINIASTAAFQPIPGNAVYAATKAFVLSLSEATQGELGGTDVSVTAVCPGPVRTEFMDAAGIEDAEERTPDFVWLEADEVARAAVEGAAKGKRVVVPGLLNRAGALSGQHTPRALLLPIAKRVWRRAM